MINNFLFAVALLSLALAVGCAKGGNGIVPPPPSIDVTITIPLDTNPSVIYPTQPLTLTAAVSHSTATTVTWSLGSSSDVSCTGTPNPCGTLVPVTPATTPATASYVAPACVSQTTVCLSGALPTITATLTSDTSITGTLGLNIVDITTDVAPATLSVGTGLTQQFTAVAVPDDAPQNFSWSCNVGGSGGPTCVDFCYGSGCSPPIASGLAIYTYSSADSCSGKGCIQISAASTIDQTGCSPSLGKSCTIAAVTPVASRVSGTYAFRFSGYQNGSPVWVAGTFTADTSGNVTTGTEEVLTATGPQNTFSIAGGSYTPTSSDPNNSNNAGTLTLLPQGVSKCISKSETYPCEYQVVLDGGGDLEMIESDKNGTGSGIAQISSSKLFTGTTPQNYAFGFTGVDSNGSRVGYAGVLQMNGNVGKGNEGIAGGQVDVNDNSTANSYSNVTGGYYPDASVSGLWHVTGLTLASGTTLDFDFFVASGTTNKATPLTFYAISTDIVGKANPAAVSGTMVLQETPPSGKTYNNAFFNGTSVSALTGTVTEASVTCAVPPCTNVSLTLGTTDGTTDGNGNGGCTGAFDQNNAGTIVSVPPASPSPCAPPVVCSFSYTYQASSSANGRYTFQMLGDPNANPVVPAVPFVLYASGANRGFLLDQSSPSVMTGTMSPQGSGGGSLAASELPGTYAAATTSSGSSAVTPLSANLLLTYAGGVMFDVSGTEYPGPLTVTSTNNTLSFGGTAPITLTAPSPENYVIYVLGTLGCTGTLKNPNPACEIQSFFMMDETTTPNPDTNASIIFAQQ